MRRPRTVHIAALVLAALASGCSSLQAYGIDRLRDLSDVVDVRYGTGLGLGLQLDATMFFGAGLGWSEGEFSRAWFGRRAVDTRASFVGLVFGDALNGGPCMTSPADGWMHMIGFNVAMLAPMEWAGDRSWFEGHGDAVPFLDTFRFGGTLFLPGVHGGLHLNVGEVADFAAGIFTLDLAHDDGFPKGPPEEPDAASPAWGSSVGLRPRGR